MGQPLYCSAASAGVWREKGYGDVSTCYTWLSSIALLPWLPGFPPQAFPTTIFSLTFPQSVLSCQQQPSSWACSTIPILQLPVTAPSSEPAFLSWVRMIVAKIVWFSCLLPAGVLQALLCLKVYSWCIHGERCAPPTPLPSCSLYTLDINILSKYDLHVFPPFCGLSFHSVDKRMWKNFFFFYFAGHQFIYFYFCCLSSWCHSQ